jgi:CheY-like chemotaxis protein
MGIEKARSSLTVPLRLHDAVIGVLNVESPRAGDFSEDDRQFAEIFGRYIALALNILDLLVVERYTSVGKLAINVADEIEDPLKEIVSQASSLVEENIGHDDLRKRLHAIIDSATAIRQTVRQVAQAPTTMLGRGKISKVQADPAMNDKRVLIADDDAAILNDLADLLSRYGCIVEQARDGAEASAMVRSRDYHLVLSDIRMPHATGYDIFAAARARSATTPVILMTGFGYDPNHSIFRARQEGIFGVLFKPFKVEQVLELVRKALVPAG